MIVDFLEFTKTEPCFARPFSGVQFIPHQYSSYVLPLNIDTKDRTTIYRIYLLDCFGNETSITKSAKIVGNKLVLTNLDYDLDRRCVIKISFLSINSKSKIFYSNIIKVSSEKKEETMLVSYKCDKGELYNIQLQMFEMYSKRRAELETYTQTSTNNQVSFLPFNVKYYAIHLRMMWIETLNKLIDVFKNDSVYFDLEQVNLFAIPEIEDLEQDIYITEARFEVTKLGNKLNDDLFLATESRQEACYIDFSENVQNLYIKDKKYRVYNNNGVRGINDEIGNFKSESSILAEYQTIANAYCEMIEISYITTEKTEKFKINK